MTATIETIRPDIELSNTAFMAKCAPQVPEGAAVLIAWIDADGVVHMRCNGTKRRDWTWVATHLNSWAMSPFPIS